MIKVLNVGEDCTKGCLSLRGQFVLLLKKAKACSAIFNCFYVTVVSTVIRFVNIHNLACAACTLLLQIHF